MHFGLEFMTVHDARREDELYYTRAPSPHIDTLSGSRASLLFVDYYDTGYWSQRYTYLMT